MTPIIFEWDGEAMVPMARFAKTADQQYVVHQHYRLEEVRDRSTASHGHYFAAVHEAWANLPELIADRWPTADMLRKWALVQTGYRDETTFLASSKAEALRVAAFMRSIDEYAVVTVSDCVVIRATAKSQSYRAMGKQDFEASKAAVLDVLAKLIGVTPDNLRAEGQLRGTAA